MSSNRKSRGICTIRSRGETLLSAALVLFLPISTKSLVSQVVPLHSPPFHASARTSSCSASRCQYNSSGGRCSSRQLLEYAVAPAAGSGSRTHRGGRRTPTASLSAVAAAAATADAAANTASTVATIPSVSGVLAPLIDSITHVAPLLGSLGVLTMVIALHEAGHLVAALSQGIRVKSFSIGFGPKLVSFRGLTEEEKDTGMTIGGVASILSRLSGPSWDWGAEERRRNSSEAGADGRKSVRKNARGKSNVKGKPRCSKVETADEDVDEGVEYALRAIPVGGFVSFPNNYEMSEEGEITEYNDPNLLSNRGPASRAVVVVAGVVVNFILAWACIFGSVTTAGVVRPHFAPGVIISEIADAKGGAAVAGFQPKDVFLSINGDPLAGNRGSLEKAVGLIRASDGRPVAVEVTRDGGKPFTKMVQEANFSDRPENVREFTMRAGCDRPQLQRLLPRSHLQPSVGPAGKYSIGVRLAPNLDSIERRKASGPIEAAGMAVEETVGLAGQTFDSLVHLVSSGDTEGMSGPIEIVKIGANVANEDGATALLQFAAVISVNLAVINSLPVPGLDGGQMVFILAEFLSRKKIDRAVTETINGLALFILLTVGVSTIAGDLGIGDLLQRIVTGAISTGPPAS